MMKAPEKLGSEYYRGFLTRQGQAFYDRINAQLLRGDYKGEAVFPAGPGAVTADDCFETITRNSSIWDFRVNSPVEVGPAL